jgi:hypothetical protein
MLFGSCHCGAVRLEIARKPSQLTQCNCSICRRYGALWAYYTRKSARVVCAAGTVSPYAWGNSAIEFYHCTRCGCLTHYERAKKKQDDTRVAVNARMLEPEDIASIRIRKLDGAATWKYFDE